jgi:hypothetical protein
VYSQYAVDAVAGGQEVSLVGQGEHDDESGE